MKALLKKMRARGKSVLYPEDMMTSSENFRLMEMYLVVSALVLTVAVAFMLVQKL